LHILCKMFSKLLVASTVAVVSARMNEVWNQQQTEAAGIVWRGNKTTSPLPHEYIKSEDLPAAHNWCDNDGVNSAR